MSIPDYVRRKYVDQSRLRTFHENIEELERLYAGRSYALVRPSYSTIVHFMPIVPRHMTNRMWRDLWWHRIKKLVVHGQEFKSLCSLCPRALPCIVDQREKHSSFKCEARAQDFHIDVQRRPDAKDR